MRTIDGTVPTIAFNGTTGSVVIPDGQTSVNIQIIPRDDVVVDGAETAILTLTEEPAAAPDRYAVTTTPGDETATLTITDNPTPTTKVLGTSENVISTNASAAYSVFAADADGDGDVDVFSASVNDDKIAWYENDGSNNYTEQLISTNADAARSIFAVDADGDGDVDVFSASVNDDKIAWYENDGSNNYTEQLISTNANGASSVFAADADGDGDVDVFSASFADDKIAWYENDGSNNYTERVISTNAVEAYLTQTRADVGDCELVFYTPTNAVGDGNVAAVKIGAVCIGESDIAIYYLGGCVDGAFGKDGRV